MTAAFVVLKISGKLSSEPLYLENLSQGVSELKQRGLAPVIVHGGGEQLTALERRLGHEPRFSQGRRVTSAATLQAAAMCFLGQIQPKIVQALASTGIPTVGLSGADGQILLAKKRPPQGGIDFGLVGDISMVQPKVIIDLCQAGFVPVLSPLAFDGCGQLLNINADTVAAELALALDAQALLLLSDNPGILADRHDRTSLLTTLSLSELKALEGSGQATDGMLPKLSAIARALQGKMNKVHIAGPSALASPWALLSHDSSFGTTVYA